MSDTVNVLNSIVTRTRQRIEAKKREVPPEKVIEAAGQKMISYDFPFEKALKRDDIAFICEIKRASPSQGTLTDDFRYLDIAIEYQNAGAAAISVLTEPYYFRGSDRCLTEISNAVSIPVLRKDFVVDEYMIYESKVLGADAVLLICRVLDTDTLRRCIDIAHRLGMSALVETHNASEIRSAIDAGARVIGVNNRDLNSLKTDFSTTLRLRALVPREKIFVSESGIGCSGEINTLRDIQADAVLIGGALMCCSDRTNEIMRLRGDPRA